MDLSNYDYLPHDLLFAKLAAYEIDFKSLVNYLTRRFHRVKINSTVSEWLEVVSGILQGSILGPLLFNIFINYIFFFIQKADICNFAEDNSLFASNKCLDEVISILQTETTNILH